jgi:isoleucyl-tRNA synthetase
MLYNCYSYYQQLENKKIKLKSEDKWILSRLNSTIKSVSENLENFKLEKPFELIYDFVVNDFSRGYIKMTRDREDTKEIVGEVLEKISLMIAPFAPYISEYIYQEFSTDSVHLSSWPKVEEKKINVDLENEFKVLFGVIEKGLAERDKLQIGLKWPLASANIKCPIKLNLDSKEILMNQLNIKSIIERVNKSNSEISVKFDDKITPELEAEGYARELSRAIQAFRKDLGLEKKNKIETIIIVDENFKNILEKEKVFLKERTNSEKFQIVTTIKETFKNNIDFKIKDKRGQISIEIK